MAVKASLAHRRPLRPVFYRGRAQGADNHTNSFRHKCLQSDLDDGWKVSLLECRKQFQIEDLEKVRNENLKEVWKLSWKGVLKKGLLEAVLRSVLVGTLGEMADEQENEGRSSPRVDALLDYRRRSWHNREPMVHGSLAKGFRTLG